MNKILNPPPPDPNSAECYPLDALETFQNRLTKTGTLCGICGKPGASSRDDANHNTGECQGVEELTPVQVCAVGYSNRPDYNEAESKAVDILIARLSEKGIKFP